MTDKAFIFDLSTKRMKADGYKDSDITRVYADLATELARVGFDQRIQHSVYRSTDGDGVNSLLRLLERKDRLPLFCQYKERVHWMTCAEYSDVTGSFFLDP